MAVLDGVVMELQDSAFPLLQGMSLKHMFVLFCNI